MATGKAAEAVRRVKAAEAAGKPVSVRELASTLGISASAIYSELKRDQHRQRCPCCGQVVREGYKIDHTVLKPGVKTTPAK